MNRWIVPTLALSSFLTAPVLAGPYPPAAGQPGSDAVSYLDPRIVEWASGYQNYLPGNPVNTGFENTNEALGPASTSTTKALSLGDGGQITLTFAEPIEGELPRRRSFIGEEIEHRSPRSVAHHLVIQLQYDPVVAALLGLLTGSRALQALEVQPGDLLQRLDSADKPDLFGAQSAAGQAIEQFLDTLAGLQRRPRC